MQMLTQFEVDQVSGGCGLFFFESCLPHASVNVCGYSVDVCGGSHSGHSGHSCGGQPPVVVTPPSGGGASGG